MAKYSHSRIDAFRQCRLKYKFKYIDGIKTGKKSIEMFMGSHVHETLEKLYRDLGNCKKDSLEDLLAYYNKRWNENYSEDVTIANPEFTPENYRDTGAKCISDYYGSHEPFDDMTVLGIETEETMTLPDGSVYDIRIDKLGRIGNRYYVCDYKTGGRMKTQTEAEADTQLAMYSVWVRDNFPDAESVVLVWHMLRFDSDVRAVKTDEQLEKIVRGTVDTIKEIENCTEFPANESQLCTYCEYRQMCPAFVHIESIKDLPPEKFSEDDGVRLVDAMKEIDGKLKENKAAESELNVKKEKLEKEIVRFSKEFGCSTIYGTETQCSVKREDKVTFPEMEKLYEILQNYPEYVQVKSGKLYPLIRKSEAPEEIMDLAHLEEKYKVTLKKRKEEKEHDE